MYSPPTGLEPTAEECRSLDDEYFTSDPTGYFRSKIDSLLDWTEQASGTGEELSTSRRRFERATGPAAGSRYPTTAEQRQRQVAVDAVQVRHSTAEALLRLIHARLTCRSSAERRSLWMEVIRTPIQLRELVEELIASFESPDFFPVMAGLMIPVPGGTKLDQTSIEAVTNALHWVARATEVVSAGHLDLNAANNKIKRGVTARPEDKLRVTFTTHPPTVRETSLFPR